jgi:RNA-binding protein YhbY
MAATNNRNSKNGKNNNADKSHLDKLLEDKPPEFQASVLRFALDSGMKQDDPAFRLVQYIGYLAQLTETAPTDWKLLFKKLQGELSEWAELTTEQLAAAADQSETINNLAQSCNRLGAALNALDSTSQQQLEQLMDLSETSESLKGAIGEIPILKKLLTQLNQTLKENQVLKVELTTAQMGELKREILITQGNRELSEMKGEILDVTLNQRRLMQKIEQLTNPQTQKSRRTQMLARIGRRLENAILTWIYELNLSLSWAGAISYIFFFSLLLAFFTRVTFQFVPISLPEITQLQIDKTQQQVGYMYTKIQRIEERLKNKSQVESRKSQVRF